MTPEQLIKMLQAFIKKNPKLKDIPISLVIQDDSTGNTSFAELSRVSYHGGNDNYKYKPSLEGTIPEEE